jgi:acetoin utilization protein AcuC
MTTNTYSEVIGLMHRLAHELCTGRLLMFGGGGYTLANVPRVWAVAFSALAGAKLNNQVPSEWAAQFEQETGEDAPTQLLDSPTTDTESTRKSVKNVVEDLRENLARSPRGLKPA